MRARGRDREAARGVSRASASATIVEAVPVVRGTQERLVERAIWIVELIAFSRGSMNIVELFGEQPGK